jgi:PAS domain S-box-containing protein
VDDEIERRVRERTAELIQANERLRQQLAERKQGEEATASLAAILEATTDLVAMADGNGRLLYLNRTGRRLLGLSDEEDVSSTSLSDYHPSWANRHMAAEGVPAAIRDGVWSGESALLRRDGSEIPVFQTILAHKDAGGNLEILSTIARDVTERKQAEEDRKELLKEYRMMFDSVPALIWYKDRNNRILRVNRPAAESMRKSVADLEGKPTYDLYPDEAAAYHRDDLEVINSGKPKLGIIEQVVKGSGEKFWVQTDKVPYRNENGEIIGVIVFAIDVTDRQQAQEEVRKLNAELEQRVVERTAQLEAARESLAQRAGELDEVNKKLIESERLKSEFFANVSHDIRTPLTLTISPVESLLSGERGLLTEEQKQLLVTVHNNAVRLLHMVTGLLDFSRLEAGKIQVQREPTEIVAVTRAILADFAPLMEQKELECELDAEPQESVVDLDRYLFERILFNLLSNAVKFSSAHGKVRVVVRVANDRLRLSVTDTGIGIAEADVKNLFQKFRQLEGSATRRFEGTGLGLALVKELSDLLGGTVWVESQEGMGSTFTVECSAPRVDIQRSALSPLERKPRRLKGSWPSSDENQQEETIASRPKILIAEDNLELAAYVSSLLRGRYRTQVARDGEEALELVHQWMPDLVLSDVMMPKRDGISLCRDFKANAETARIPVILLTAMTHRDALLRGWEAGADEYLFKPFHPRELLTRISSMLAAAQERQRGEVELRRSAEELARSNAELELFASVASHDLQEPLRMISSYVDLLAQHYRGKLDDKANRWIAFAVDGAARMKQLISDLLEFSRVGTRGKPFAPTSSATVFEAAIANLQQAIRETKAVVTHGVLPTILADATQMTQVLQNLIGNAIKYRGSQRPEIRVEAVKQDGHWLFSVRDNGIGIDPLFHDRIFVIFQRLHTREEYPGTGIGLALCKKIVERHGGRIWVESQPGQGATFSFTIPDRKVPPHVPAHAGETG